MEAARLEPLPEIADVLRQSLLTSRVRLTLRAEGPINAASYGPGGTLIVTASDDGTARVYESADGRLVASLDHDAEVNDAAFSPDGRLVATGSNDRTARLWPVDGPTADGPLELRARRSGDLAGLRRHGRAPRDRQP